MWRASATGMLSWTAWTWISRVRLAFQELSSLKHLETLEIVGGTFGGRCRRRRSIDGSAQKSSLNKFLAH